MKENKEELGEIVELYGEEGDLLKFYHVGTIEHEKKLYVFFRPAEPKEGEDPDDLAIFAIEKQDGEEVLVPVEDDETLNEVYDKFVGEDEED